MSKYYACVEDRQGGGFGMGRCYTAEEWLEQAYEWRESDDSWGDYEGGGQDTPRGFLDYWRGVIADGREQELIDYISDIWDIDIQPAEKALEILEADREKWGSSEDEDETIEAIKEKIGELK